jgi:PAS domain S-box-containing protein
METDPGNHIITVLRRVSLFAAMLIIIISFTVILGWILDIPALTSLYPGFVPMELATAISFILAGTVLVLLRNRQNLVLKQYLPMLMVVSILFISFYALAHHLSESDYAQPPPMAFNAAVSFIIASIALLFAIPGFTRAILFSQLISLGLILFSTLPVIGHVLGITELFGYPLFTRMAPNTAITFLITASGMLMVFPDTGMMSIVTRQKQIETRLRESEGQYSSLIEVTKASIFIIQNRRIVYLNPAALKLFGAERQENVIGRSPFEFFHKDYHSQMEARIGRTLSGNSVGMVEEKIIQLDGTLIDVEVAATPFTFRNDLAIQVVARDITERKMAEETLRRNELLLRIAGNLAHLGGWMWDIGADKVTWSDQVAAIYDLPHGFSPSHEEEMNFVAPEFRERIKEVYESCISEGISIDEELQIISVKGHRVWVRLIGMAERDAKGVVTHVLGGIQNISDRKNSEQKLQNALKKAEQSDRLKTAFLNNLSHEIRTPLNAIVGYSELLNQSGNSHESIDHLTEIILKSSDQLLEIIEDIVNISTIETGQIKALKIKTDINLLLGSVFEKFRDKAEARGIEFHYYSDTGADQIVLTDEGKLKHILIHLVDNAIKFTDAGTVEFGCLFKDREIEFYVSDTGIGIDPALHGLIFEPFQKADTKLSGHRGGMGLGLPISKSFVEAMHGRIWLESIPGSGTVIHFSIPRIPAEGQNQEEPAIQHETRKEKLLVAEDEESNFNLLQEMLSGLEMNILHAWNGKQAVDLVKNEPGIAFVLMDIRMPVMGGYEATRHIKQIRPGLPVVAITAHAFHGERDMALDAGFDEYLAKPFPVNTLTGIIKKFLH